MNVPLDPKPRLRREARARRDALGDSFRRQASAEITRLALELPEFASAGMVSAYVSVGSEVGTRDLIARIIRLKGSVALPRLDPATGLLEHRRVGQEAAFRPGAFGIPEPDPRTCTQIVHPAEIDLSLAPGLAFDRRGHRLGMGGGHYDRFFHAALRARKFGLAFSAQVADNLPALAHDFPLDGLLTESGLLRC